MSKPAPARIPIGEKFPKTVWGYSVRVVHGILSLILRSFVVLKTENLPDFRALGPVILAPNHTSYLDPPLLQLAVPWHLTYLMTDTIYRIPVARLFFRFWKTLSVPESGRATSAIKGAVAAIKDGRPVAIFPEGRIAEDGYLQEVQPGVVLLMAMAGVPVIPVGLIGIYEILPKRARWPRRGRVIVRFGDPLIPPEGKLDRAQMQAFANEIRAAIHALGAPVKPAQGTPAALPESDA